MDRMLAQFSRVTAQFRLLCAEHLILLAYRIAPKGHPDSEAIRVSAYLVCSRLPT